MSQISEKIFGAIAVSLTLGAVQFASGHDLTGGLRAAASIPPTVVNRTIKTDRATHVAAPSVPMQTISIRVDGLSDTSILVRLPLVGETRSTPAAPKKSGNPKLTVACEPVVSVLTEVAKLLQPGRCIT